MSWFVCTIGRSSLRNWDLCKEVDAYGIPGRKKPPMVSVDDRLAIWLGGRGYVAEAVVVGPLRVPKSKAEAPWPGGTYEYGFIVPFRVICEVQVPVSIPFEGQVQAHTGVSKAQLRRSFTLMSDVGGSFVHDVLIERAATEAKQRQDP